MLNNKLLHKIIYYLFIYLKKRIDTCHFIYFYYLVIDEITEYECERMIEPINVYKDDPA